MSLTTARVAAVRQALPTLPKAVAQALADRDKVAAAAAAFRPAGVEDVAAAVVAALIADRDPLEDEQVRRLTTSRALAAPSGDLMAVVDTAERRVADTLGAHVDAVLDTLHEAAEQAGDVLADAHRVLGDIDLEKDTATVGRMGPDAARAWAQAREASQRLTVLDRAWSALAALTGFASEQTDRTTRLADLDLDLFERVGRKAEPWAIVRAGGAIDLADRATIGERVERLEGQRIDRQAQSDGAVQQAYRRTHAPIA